MDIKPLPRDPTPEERLFRIIREGKALQAQDLPLPPTDPETAAGTVHVKKAKRAAMRLAESGFLRRFRKSFFTMRTVNGALATSLATLCMYFVVTQFLWKESLSATFMQKAAAPSAANSGTMPSLVMLGDLKQEIAPVKGRNLFQPWKPDPVSESSAAPSTPQPPQGASGRFKLSGIYMSDPPEALLEAVDDKKTYAVTAGTEIKGIKIKEVRADGVVVIEGDTERLIQ
jgi:hypothetical protein